MADQLWYKNKILYFSKEKSRYNRQFFQSFEVSRIEPVQGTRTQRSASHVAQTIDPVSQVKHSSTELLLAF